MRENEHQFEPDLIEMVTWLKSSLDALQYAKDQRPASEPAPAVETSQIDQPIVIVNPNQFFQPVEDPLREAKIFIVDIIQKYLLNKKTDDTAKLTLDKINDATKLITEIDQSSSATDCYKVLLDHEKYNNDISGLLHRGEYGKSLKKCLEHILEKYPNIRTNFQGNLASHRR